MNSQNLHSLYTRGHLHLLNRHTRDKHTNSEFTEYFSQKSSLRIKLNFPQSRRGRVYGEFCEQFRDSYVCCGQVDPRGVIATTIGVTGGIRGSYSKFESSPHHYRQKTNCPINYHMLVDFRRYRSSRLRTGLTADNVIGSNDLYCFLENEQFSVKGTFIVWEEKHSIFSQKNKFMFGFNEEIGFFSQRS